MAETTTRYAVVTGANKGIGFGICKQLVLNGIIVVLTARDEKRGLEAVEKLKQSSVPSDRILFHQLDVADCGSVACLADFIKTQFGKLDILVNNAGVSGATVDGEALKNADIAKTRGRQVDWRKIVTQTYELTEQGININYYGPKRMVEAFIPLLQLSDSPRIINVSSSMGKLETISSNIWATQILSDVNNLTEEKIEEVVNQFLKDSKQGVATIKGWPPYLSAYTVSKVALNTYTRALAKKFPDILTNCVCPGFVKTDMNFNAGNLTIDEGAESPVRLALLPKGGPSGLFFLALNGVTVVLTARDEKRGLEASEKLKQFEISDCIFFHQLDVADPSSIYRLADFIKTRFGKLDILVNNAGVAGAITRSEIFRDADLTKTDGLQFDWSKTGPDTYELIEKGITINYYGPKRMCEAFIPLLQLSDSPRIVNVSSVQGKLQHISSNEWATRILSDADNLTEQRVEEVVIMFLKDTKQGIAASKGWPPYLSSYTVSKAALNAYTRALAKKFPNILINCVCPGYVKTDITFNFGILTVDEGADSPVKLALLPNGGPSGQFFFMKEPSSF
ncbi:hypothetical protein ACFE04_018583 [Oxalis oulophora]